jgi:hypothetical protein
MSLLWVALAAAPLSWGKLDAPARQALLTEKATLPLPQRLLAFSQAFVGTPYVNSPLGEGEGKDADPRIRFDAVDCLTFVEQTIALALSLDDEKALPTLDAIRYGDGVAYEKRNHVMEAQWLPSNMKKGYLRDVTRRYGGAATRHVTKVLDDRAWSSKLGVNLDLPRQEQVRGEFGLDIVPAEGALEVLKAVPDGTLIVVVRADRPHLVTRITHVGFLVHKAKGAYMRHASRTFKAVTDESLHSYLKRNLGYAKWTVEGFALFEVTAPAS